jgi:hypothetical protein
MEEIIDALVVTINELALLDYADGGFADEIEITDTVWFGDPGFVADQQYPLVYVQPVRSAEAGGTNKEIWTDHTVEIGCLTDPRFEWDSSEVVEATATRELIRTGASIRKRLQQFNTAMPGGLAPRVRSVSVTEVTYPPQERGGFLLSSVTLTVVVQRAEDRVK